MRNNIVAGTDYAGIAIYAAQQPQVYNNTLVDTARVGQASIYLTTASATVTTDPSIVNNIVTRTVAGARPLVFITANGFTGTLTMDHNRYHNGGAEAGFWDERSGSTFYGTFAAWPAHIGGRVRQHARRPGAGRDRAPRRGQPQHRRGADPGGGRGRHRPGRPRGAYDIGADEYAAGAIPVNRPPVANADTATTAHGRCRSGSPCWPTTATRTATR